jgi:hypothetical protein
VFSVDGSGRPVFQSWEGTTEPGTFWTMNPMNAGGAARIAFGQYKSWIVGTHMKGKASAHEALVQVTEVTVHRDLNKDFKRTNDRTDTGLFGVYAGTSAKDAPELVNVIAGEMKSLAGAAGEDEVLRAKAQIKSGLLMGMEQCSARCEHMAAQYLTFGRLFEPSELIARIEAVGEVGVPVTTALLEGKLDRFLYLVIHEDCHDQFEFPYGFEEALCNLIAYQGMKAFSTRQYGPWSRTNFAVR